MIWPKPLPWLSLPAAPPSTLLAPSCLHVPALEASCRISPVQPSWLGTGGTPHTSSPAPGSASPDAEALPERPWGPEEESVTSDCCGLEGHLPGSHLSLTDPRGAENSDRSLGLAPLAPFHKQLFLQGCLLFLTVEGWKGDR